MSCKKSIAIMMNKIVPNTIPTIETATAMFHHAIAKIDVKKLLAIINIEGLSFTVKAPTKVIINAIVAKIAIAIILLKFKKC
jgi:hypothetical protein